MTSQTAVSKERKLWSEWEDSILRNEVGKQSSAGPVKSWRDIAAKIPGRSNKDCRKRWMKLDSTINKGPWSKQEDDILRTAVQQCSHAWTEVARLVKSRNPDQCAKRWLHFLNPELDHSEWTEADDQRLLSAVDKYGHNWKRIIESSLAGRSATDAKNRFSILTRNGRNKNLSQDSKAPRVRRRRVTNLTVRSEPETISTRTRQPANETLLQHVESGLDITFDKHSLDFGGPLENMQNFSELSDLDFGSDIQVAQHDFRLSVCFDPFLTPLADDMMPQTQQSADYFSEGMISRHSGGKYMHAGQTGMDTQHTPQIFTESSASEILNDSRAYIVRTPLSLSSGPSPTDTHDDPDALNDEDDDDEEMSCDEDLYESGTDQNVQEPRSECVQKAREKASAPTANNPEKRKTIMLQDISSDLAKQVLDVVFSSGSPVTIKISDQN